MRTIHLFLYIAAFITAFTLISNVVYGESNMNKTCIGDIAGCFSFPEDINRVTLKDEKLNLWIDADDANYEEYLQTIELAESKGVLVKMHAPDHSYRIQIPLIRLYADNIELEKVTTTNALVFKTHRIYIKCKNPPAVIGSICLNCSSEVIEMLINHYNAILDRLDDDVLLEVNLTKPADDVINLTDTDNYFDPNNIFVVKENPKKFKIFKTKEEVTDFGNYILNRQTDSLLFPIEISSTVIPFSRPVILETFNEMLNRAKEERVWVSVRQMGDLAVQYSILPTSIPLEMTPGEEN